MLAAHPFTRYLPSELGRCEKETIADMRIYLQLQRAGLHSISAYAFPCTRIHKQDVDSSGAAHKHIFVCIIGTERNGSHMAGTVPAPNKHPTFMLNTNTGNNPICFVAITLTTPDI